MEILPGDNKFKANMREAIPVKNITEEKYDNNPNPHKNKKVERILMVGTSCSPSEIQILKVPPTFTTLADLITNAKCRYQLRNDNDNLDKGRVIIEPVQCYSNAGD